MSQLLGASEASTYSITEGADFCFEKKNKKYCKLAYKKRTKIIGISSNPL